MRPNKRLLDICENSFGKNIIKAKKYIGNKKV